jgi:hypothetical protein
MGSQITGKDLSPHHMRLQREIDQALEDLPAVVVQYFFSFIKERGERMLEKFRTYKRRHCRTASFGDFIWMTTARKPLAKAFSPEGCTLPPHALAATERVANTLLRTIDENKLLEAGLTEIYFGRKEAYLEVRRNRCMRCPQIRCMHNHPPPIRP